MTDGDVEDGRRETGDGGREVGWMVWTDAQPLGSRTATGKIDLVRRGLHRSLGPEQRGRTGCDRTAAWALLTRGGSSSDGDAGGQGRRPDRYRQPRRFGIPARAGGRMQAAPPAGRQVAANGPGKKHGGGVDARHEARRDGGLGMER